MRTYEVQFYYGTDLRTSQVVDAYDDLKALAAALQIEGINEWIVSPDMKVVIVQKP